MTDRETKQDAIRLATEAAKKQALEQVASYLESVTVVRDLDVTQDEIRSYTAGRVLVLDQQVKTDLDGDIVVIGVTLTAQVDTAEVAQAITALKQNEDARQELLTLKREMDQLQQELGAANEALAAATSPEQARQLNQQRNELLDRAQSNAMVAQAWTDWALMAQVTRPYAASLAQVQALLGLASRLNPNNPHLAVVQQVVGTKAPPMPPQPPRPPVPHTVPFLPGYYVVPQQPGQPDTTRPSLTPPNSPPLSSVHQLNPLLPDPSGQFPISGNTSASIPIPAQPGIPQPSSGRSMMPTYRLVPPPNGRPALPTLHTHQPGGDRIAPSGPQSPVRTPQHMRPPVVQQVPPGAVTAPMPPPQQIPYRNTDQGGQ